jgi:hypothetical protein
MPLWYGAQPAWWAPLERDARRQFGDALRHSYRRDSLTYELTGLDVIGEPDPIDVRIRFHADPPYSTYGQRPEDFPRVHAKPGVPSKHRYRFDELTDEVSGLLAQMGLPSGVAPDRGIRRRGPLRDARGHSPSGGRRTDEPRLGPAADHHRRWHESRFAVSPRSVNSSPSRLHRGNAASLVTRESILMPSLSSRAGSRDATRIQRSTCLCGRGMVMTMGRRCTESV